MELADFWKAVRRGWATVLAVTIAALALGTLYIWRATPSYESSSQLFVSTSQNDTNTAYQGGMYATQRVTSYADLVTSNELAGRAAELLDDAAAPEDLAGMVRGTVSTETVILTITARNDDPELARDIAQAYAVALSGLIRELESPVDEQKPPLIKATIVDRAELPKTPVSPRPIRDLSVAALLGFALGVGFVTLRELLDTTVKTDEDIAEITDLPVLGNIYSDSEATGDPATTLLQATPWAESFRVLRTNMQYLDVDNQHRVIIVSSPLPQDGKSTISANIAVSLATSGQRVALVECDLRKPTLAGRLHLDDAVGTSAVLIGRLGAWEAFQSYGDSGLQVMVAGTIPPNPTELLQSQAMGRLVAELRGEFDYVILDAPPLLPVADAAVLAQHADGSVVVVRQGRSKKDALRHALERLTGVGAHALGVVFNMTPTRKSGYGYGYGYGYGEAATAAAVQQATEPSRVPTPGSHKAEEDAGLVR